MSIPEDHGRVIDEMCERLMRDVVSVMSDIGQPIGDRHVDAAVNIMRAEMKEFISGDGYAPEREALRMRSIHHGVVWKSLVSGCCTKILAAQKEGR